MRTVPFPITEAQLNTLLRGAKDGKNSDIGKIAIEVVKLYFLSQDQDCTFKIGKRNQPDIIVTSKGKSTGYEVKGTQDADIAFDKLKVSSKFCRDELINGMEIIRVTNIRSNVMKLHFLKYGSDFTLVHEARWAVKEIRDKKRPSLL